MKILFALFLVLTTNLLLFAQPGGREMPKIGEITGTVYDSVSQKALEFATVSVFSIRDSSLIGGVITDGKGAFTIGKLPLGRHRVTINYMGYETYTIQSVKLLPNNPSTDLGEIYVRPTAATLEIAEVTADKAVFELGLDKKVFNVDKTNLGDSENATEILRNTPTVEVDFDGAVKIRGSEVQVYINGKPTGLTGDSQAEILDQLPANSVKKVELITSPSAKYDPEGGSGIINIVLKKNVLEGFTGSANLSVGTSTWNPFKRYRGGLSLNFRNNKINIFSNFSYNYGEKLSRGHNFRSTTSAQDTSFLEQYTNSVRLQNGGMARVGMDYYFDDYNTLTIATRIRPSGGGNNSAIQYDFFDANQDKTQINERLSDGIQNRFSMTYNVIYAKVFKQKKKKGESAGPRRDNSEDSGGKRGEPGRRGGGNSGASGRSGTIGDKQELVIDLQYSMNNNAGFETFSEQFYAADWTAMNSSPDSQKTTNYQKMHQGTVMIDYTHPFGKEMKFEVGYKGNIRWMGNDFTSETFDYAQMQMVDDIGLSNNFQYQEQVHALYATFAQKIGKFNYKIGLRGEYTLTDSRLVYPTDSTFVNNYPSIFPTINMSYALGKNQQIQLGFSRRIQRPSSRALNPFPSYSDPLNLKYGNPYLLPQYTNAVELTYVNYWKGGNTLMLTGFYKYNTDLIENLRTLRSDGVSVLTQYNFNTSHMWGGELVTRFSPYKWFNFGLTGSLYHNIQNGTNIDASYTLNAIAGNANVYMNFVFKFGMRIAVYAWYSVPTKVAQGRTGGYTWNSLSVSQKVLKDKGTLTLSVKNPILGGRYQFETFDDNGLYQIGEREWESPVIELRFSYRFGKVTVRDSRSKNAGRLNSGGGNSEGGNNEGGIE